MKYNTKQKIFAFDLKNVYLLPGMFKNQFEQMKDYFLAIPNDDMLYGFRKRAGLPHPGRELGGWYNNDASGYPDLEEVFNTFGQWLGAYAKIYSVTKDAKALEKLQYLVNEWGKTIVSV